MTKCFIVNSADLNGILSPLFFITKPKDSRGLVELSTVSTVNPTRRAPSLALDRLVPYVGLPETDDQEIKEIHLRPYKEVKGRNIIKKGDILFARIEPSIFNKKYIFVEDLRNYDYAFTSTEFYIVENKDNVNRKFLFYMFFTDLVYNQVIGKTTGSTGRRRLDKGVFEKLLIPLPPLETQNKIVKIMGEAYKLKKSKEHEAQKLLESISDYMLTELGIKISVINDKKCYAFNSEEINKNRLDPYYYQPKFIEVGKAIKKGKYRELPLCEVAQEILSGQRPKGGVRQILKGVPSLGGEHVFSDGSIATQDLKFIPTEFHKEHLKSKVKKLDILLVKDGATTGKTGIVPEDYPHEEANINEHVFLIRCSKEANPYYLFSILKSPIGETQINREVTGGTIMGIIRDSIENIKIPLPFIETQNKIADEVKKRIQKAEQLHKEAKELIKNAKAEVGNILLK